jgi:uncharacterized protein (TIGR03437 family)
MNRRNCRNGACAAFLLCATAIALPAQTVTYLASFNGTNGAAPLGALVQGTDGNFYGTTAVGGASVSSGGTVFKITPEGTLTTLYSFCSLTNCADGANPHAGLIQASDGNFYGTTYVGGTPGVGTVFKITPGGALTTLHSFMGTDGEEPEGGLIQASDGDFYGTTVNGGTNQAGTVFKITPGGTLTTLYSFCSATRCSDGAYPVAGLIQATDGNFYGTTALDQGTIFKMTPGGTLTTIYTFCSLTDCTDGYQPLAPMIQASDGNFYGTTSGGGEVSGTVFKMTQEGLLTPLYISDAFFPAPLIQASDGNFYGTSYGPGDAVPAGTIFKLTPSGTLTMLYAFCTNCAYGAGPSAGLIQATDGNLYGTTSSNGGSVFKLTLGSSTTSPAINQTAGIVSGASFQPGIASGSWITITGTNLSPVTDTWANAITNGNLPTSLDGVSVSIGGQPAYVAYVSPTQINAVAPNISSGTVSVTVTTPSGTSSAITATAQPVQPAFFQWPGNYAVATRQDYSLAVKNGTFPSLTTTPAKPGDVIILWGTGFGPTSPPAPEGEVVPSSTTYNSANPVTVTVGTVSATVYGAALAPGYAGLYQIAIQIPPSMSNGDYAVIATVLSGQSPSTTLIAVQQ